MCELCGTPEETKAGRNKIKNLAVRLHKVAGVHEDLASGAIKPHSDILKDKEAMVRMVIRELVNEWI